MQSPRNRLEHPEVGVLGREWPERQSIAEVVERVPVPGVQLPRQLPECYGERLLERRALVLGDGLVGDQHREDLGLGDRQRGEPVHWPRVEETVPAVIVSDGEVQAVRHELDVPLHGAKGDAKILRHADAVGQPAGFDPLVNPRHPVPGRPAESAPHCNFHDASRPKDLGINHSCVVRRRAMHREFETACIGA